MLYSSLEKECLLFLTLSIAKEMIDLDQLKMKILPYEDSDIKLNKINMVFQNSDLSKKFTPAQTYNILNHFQSHRFLSSNTTLLKSIWKLFLSFIFSGLPFQNIERNLDFILGFIEEVNNIHFVFWR